MALKLTPEAIKALIEKLRAYCEELSSQHYRLRQLHEELSFFGIDLPECFLFVEEEDKRIFTAVKEIDALIDKLEEIYQLMLSAEADAFDGLRAKKAGNTGSLPPSPSLYSEGYSPSGADVTGNVMYNSAYCEGVSSGNTPFSDDIVEFVLCGHCGSKIYSGNKFCSGCGKKTEYSNDITSVSQVQFSAVAPKTFIKDEYTELDIYMYEEDYRKAVEKALEDESLKESASGIFSVEDKTRVKIELTSPDVEIDDNVYEQVWNGKFLKFDFAVYLPEDYGKKQIMFTAKIYFNDIPATRLKFIARCKSFREQKLEVIREDVLSAFVSYASADRSKVAGIIQGMKKVRPDIDLFFDVENLRSGDDWENALMTEISRRDLLYLCWSRNAKKSEWVDREWRYALDKKGIDCIEPVPLDSPELCPPPKELSSKHFNDRALVYSGSPDESGNAKQKNECSLAFLLDFRNNNLIYINKEEFLVGRSSGAVDLCIADNSTVSKVHAKILCENGVYYAVDCDSKNGTTVNGRRIQGGERAELPDKSEICFGTDRFRFFAPIV